MKKKLFAALTAGMMLCGMLTAPVSAAETYPKGDVNMDGVVDVEDAQIVLVEYTQFIAGETDQTTFTPEQVELATITGNQAFTWSRKYQIPFSVNDAQVILLYATDCVSKLPVPDDIIDYNNQIKAKYALEK